MSCQRKSVYISKPNARILFSKTPIKGSDFLLANTKSRPKWPIKFFVSHTLGTKKTKNNHLLENFHFCVCNFICLHKLLYSKVFIVKISGIPHSKTFFDTFHFFNSWSVKNNKRTYLSKFLKEYRNFWDKKSANPSLSVPDVCT